DGSGLILDQRQADGSSRLWVANPRTGATVWYRTMSPTEDVVVPTAATGQSPAVLVFPQQNGTFDVVDQDSGRLLRNGQPTGAGTIPMSDLGQPIAISVVGDTFFESSLSPYRPF